MEWVKDYVDSDDHPQMVTAGFWGREVFRCLCRLSGKYDLGGRMAASYLDGNYLAGRIGLTTEISPAPASDCDAGVQRCLKAGLLVREKGGAYYVIDGWSRRQPSSTKEAERMRRFREKRYDPGNGRVTIEKGNRTQEVEVEVELEKEKDQKPTSSQLALTPAPPAPGSGADRVFGYWARMLKHPRAILDKKRRKLIDDRLDEGASEADLYLAVDGVLVDMQSWPERRRFDGIEYVFENRASVEKFMDLADKGNPFKPGGHQEAGAFVNQHAPSGTVHRPEPGPFDQPRKEPTK